MSLDEIKLPHEVMSTSKTEELVKLRKENAALNTELQKLSAEYGELFDTHQKAKAHMTDVVHKLEKATFKVGEQRKSLAQMHNRWSVVAQLIKNINQGNIQTEINFTSSGSLVTLKTKGASGD